MSKEDLYISKLRQKSQSELMKQADRFFNAFIRARDAEKGCVSCDSYKVEHASHLYSAGNYKGMRYLEDNVHGSCAKCNTHLRGNLLEYRSRLLLRIGKERVEKLELLAAWGKRNPKPIDRLTLIEIIIKYKSLTNKLK